MPENDPPVPSNELFARFANLITKALEAVEEDGQGLRKTALDETIADLQNIIKKLKATGWHAYVTVILQLGLAKPGMGASDTGASPGQEGPRVTFAVKDVQDEAAKIGLRPEDVAAIEQQYEDDMGVAPKPAQAPRALPAPQKQKGELLQSIRKLARQISSRQRRSAFARFIAKDTILGTLGAPFMDDGIYANNLEWLKAVKQLLYMVGIRGDATELLAEIERILQIVVKAEKGQLE